MNFENLITRNLYGEKVMLDNEYYFYPKKFSIAGKDELNEYRASTQRKISDEGLELIDKISTEHPELKDMRDEERGEQIIKFMNPEELKIFRKSVPDSVSKRKSQFEMFLKYGVGLNNLNEKGEEKEGLTEKVRTALLENEELCVEMYTKINEFNDFFSGRKKEETN